MSGQIFISYRRDDASFPAGRVYDRLAAHFPKNQIFMDVDSLDPGADFLEAVRRSVGSCEVLIAVIGKRWLNASDEEGRRRIDNPDDLVRLEISTALQRNIRVIPVLVDGAVMPRSSELPDDLKLMVWRNALEVSHSRFSADLGRLITALERVFEKADAERKPREEQDRVEAEQLQREQQERLEDEKRQREGTSNGKTVPPIRALTQKGGPSQAETPPLTGSQGTAMRKPFGLRASVVVVVLLLIFGMIWFAGSKYARTGRKLASVSPTPSPVSSDPTFYMNRGWGFYQKKDYDKAISDYNEAIRLDPNLAWTYDARGSIYEERNEYDKAISDYNNAIRLNPKFSYAYVSRARIFFQKREYEKAISDLNEAIRLDPKFALAYTIRGNNYLRKKEYEKAFSDYNEAISLDPNLAVAYQSRGVAYYEEGNYTQAQSDFDTAKKLGYSPQ
ncbi:MAG: tetratricopeptide repeat protein [Verrucomicrobia bacterium]|nr:tetratricopeptide repeat protein [Verrucomicrobiota bacterium]